MDISNRLVQESTDAVSKHDRGSHKADFEPAEQSAQRGWNGTYAMIRDEIEIR
ncbi:MAG: hypothetical protein H0X65_18485 [Gemmatimonadetes bacterium]|jgi:hypothetical protein|nr:hypothetical protein [Gemmatimonadota bacterium]